MIKVSEDIKEKLDLNPDNMNEIAKEAYYRLENYIFTLEKTQNNWNELKEFVEEEIKHLEKSRYVSFNEYGENKLRIFKDFQFKMQELQRKGNNE